MKSVFRFTAITLSASFLTLSAMAGNWPNWRGPASDGSSEETGIPAAFSASENCLWTAPMPGPAASTPVVWGDHVFVTSTNEKEEKLLGLCLDRKTGKVLWQKEIGTGFRQDDRSNYAGPSPVTDGERVIFFFGTGDMAAFAMDGTELWKRNVQKDHGSFAFLWTFSSSPVLAWGTLYLQVLQRDTAVNGNGGVHGNPDGRNDSYLLALDPASGADRWKHVRPADAVAESLESFATPMPWTFEGQKQILIAGGDCLTSHNADNGEELWRWGSWNPEKISHWRLVPGPVAGDGVVLACAPKRAPIYAVKAGGRGVLKDSDLAWTSSDEVNSRHVSSDVSTPLFYRGHFYVMNSDRQSLLCVEPKSGKLLWEYRVEGGAKIESSPTAADGRIYVIDQRAKVSVLAAGPEAKLLHQTQLGGDNERDVRSSIALASGCAFIRTNAALYCFGTP